MSEQPTQPDTIHPQWIGYYAALTLVLLLLAQVESLRELVVALAWLIALSVLIMLIDPKQGNLFGNIGLKGT